MTAACVSHSEVTIIEIEIFLGKSNGVDISISGANVTRFWYCIALEGPAISAGHRMVFTPPRVRSRRVWRSLPSKSNQRRILYKNQNGIERKKTIVTSLMSIPLLLLSFSWLLCIFVTVSVRTTFLLFEIFPYSAHSTVVLLSFS